MQNRFGTLAAIATCAVAMLAATARDAAACHFVVGDRVWYDANGNGIQDAGESGIAGVRLTISPQPSDGVTLGATEAISDASGLYQFAASSYCGVTYTISVDASSPALAGLDVTLIHAGSNTAIDSNNPAGVSFTASSPAYVPPSDPDYQYYVNDVYTNMTFDFGYRAPACTGAIGDFVWFDANTDGIQNAGETGIAGAAVSLNGGGAIATSAGGLYSFAGLCAGTYRVCVAVPPGAQVSPANQGGDDATDSDGTADTTGNSCVSVTLASNNSVDNTNDFGFYQARTQPGTGTPGYWKTHPEAWPVETITIGSVAYSKAQAIALMEANESRDVTYIMFRDLVSAKLNVLIGNDSSCVASAISAGDDWMSTYGPVTSGVRASSAAWRVGEPIHRTLDNYNNGMLCAPHRD